MGPLGVVIVDPRSYCLAGMSQARSQGFVQELTVHPTGEPVMTLPFKWPIIKIYAHRNLMPTKDDFPKDLAADAVLPFTLSGIFLEIPRSMLTPELWLAFEAGYYEGSEISALRSAIRPGDTVLEVGAGVGFISAFVQRALGATTVWVIEANEALIPTIHRTHQLNNVSATVLTGVAGRSDGPVSFHHQAAFWASSVLPLPDSQATTVPGIDLGRVICEMQPDVLVVDIEGGERDLFAGLDLSGVRKIVVEVHHPQIGSSGIAECFAALQNAGFAYDPDGSAGTNVVFTRFCLSRPNGSRSSVLEDSLRRELEIAREERAQAQAGLAAVEHSTAWRLTGPLRGVARRLPGGLRRNLARSVYVVWWAVSLQLPARLRHRAMRNATASTPAAAVSGTLATDVLAPFQNAACVIAATNSLPAAPAVSDSVQALGFSVNGWINPVDSDKNYWHRYSPFYKRHFATLQPVSSILEFGVFHGASTRWLRQMYPDAEIVAVDILPQQPDWPVDPGITYLTLDQSDRAAVARALKSLNRNFDLVIEDGSHIPQHQATCLAEAFPLVRPGGLYVLEDLQTSHPTHPYYRDHCAQGTPDSLHLLLLIEHLRATDQALRPGDVASLAAPGLFTPEDIYQLSETIAEVDLYHRTTLPLRCYACGTDDFDPVALLCRCGNDLDILGADSMTAVIRRSAAISGLLPSVEKHAMTEIDQTISSLAEWENWVVTNPGVKDAAAAAEIGKRILRTGFTEPLTGKFVQSNEITHSGLNWREGLMANGLNSRIRAVIAVIAEKVAGRPASAMRIFGAEAVTPFALLMRGSFSRFIGSEYGMNETARLELFPIPHQDLTALTFPSNCFDIVTTNEVLEHVSDLDAALREMARVLTPGGWHIGTHPFWFMRAKSDRRSETINGEIVHLKEAEYHGNPIDPEGGSLVCEIPGWDIIDRAKAAGFRNAHMRFIASERYGYLTEDTGVFVFCAQK